MHRLPQLVDRPPNVVGVSLTDRIAGYIFHSFYRQNDSLENASNKELAKLFRIPLQGSEESSRYVFQGGIA